MATPLTIGVRDSGVGGLTVARRIKDVLPHARLLYFADTAHVPYGGRAPEEVRHFALSIAHFLVEHGAQIVVFACNTSSAIALEEARQTFTVPVIGTIEPGARAAVETSNSGRIGVIATQATVESGVYSQWIHRLRRDAEVHEVACPDFVPLVENEQTESRALTRPACATCARL
jgi:glutamate racemase